MRKLKQLRLLVLLLIASMAFTGHADPKREFRSGWFTCVSNMDWPTTKGTSATAIAAQKAEMIAILDAMQEAHLNSASFHALPMSDAFYPSQYLPWSQWLTGTRGTAPSDPTWNPLQFFIDECHKRGMQALAWLNPYRYSGNASATYVWHTTNAGWNNSLDREMQQHIINHNYYYTLNPGDPWSLQHLKNVVTELAGYHDLDGIIFDDYFYPNLIPENNTATDWSTYQSYKNKGGTLSIGDWRRSNVNTMVKELYATIKSIDPNMTFGISPAGIAGSVSTSGNKYTSDGVSANPCNNDWQYNQIYSDPLAWLKDRSIDYISPQLYWATTHSTNAYGTQIDWWSNVANIFGRHCYASHYIASGESQASTSNIIKWENPSTFSELKSEVDLNRSKTRNNAPGSILFSIKWLQTKTDMRNYIENNVFTRPSLRPVMSWMPKGNYSAPGNLALNGNTLSWDKVTSDRGAQYAVYAIPNSVLLAKSKGSDGIKGDYLIAAPYGNSVEIPTQYRNGYWFAVTAVDAAGNEYEPTTINEPDPTVIPDIVPSLASIESLDKWSEVWRNNSYNSDARNLCYGDGKVFVATTDGNIHVLDAKTGTLIKNLNMSGVSGGTFSVCGVQYRNGKIYAANLTTAPSSSTSPIKVYCWDNIDAAPSVVLNVTTSELSRVGDHFGMSDNYIFFVRDNKAIRYRIGTTTMEKTTLPITLSTTPHIDPVDDSYFWVNSMNTNPIKYKWVTNGNATQAETTGGILGNTNGTAFAPFTMSNGNEYGFVVDYLNNRTQGCANLIRKQSGSWNTGANVHLPQAGLGTADNSSYGSSIAVNLSDANGVTTAVDMWILVTNQGIAHYTAGAEDSYASDGIGRFYRIPGSGPYAGRKLMELTLPKQVGTFRLSCKKDMEYGIDVSGDSKENDADVIIYKTRQTFEITHRADGYCTISRNGNCLTIQGNPTTVSNGNNILMYEYNGGTNQLWKFVRNDDGSYTIISKKNKDFVLDVNGGTMANSTNVQLYSSNNSDAQKWILEPVGNAAMPYYAVPDSYFQKFLIKEGYARIYNENSHQITGTATLGANFDTYAKAGSGEHVVILPETIAALTEFNGLGEYGDEKPHTTQDGKSYTQFEGVNSLKGIEYFTELKTLDMCRAKYGTNAATYGGIFSIIQDGEMNLKYNTKLEYIDLDFADIIDFGQTGIKNLKNLKYLNLNNNAHIKSIDISQLESLEQLNTDHCVELTQINASHNENMKVLSIFDTMIGYDSNYSLQKLVDNFPYLAFLYAHATYNSELDMSKHTKLQSLWVHNSAFANRQKAKGNWLHKLDLSGCTELRDIHVQNMHLAALNIPSTHLGENFTDEFKNLIIGRELGANSTPHGSTPPHYVDADNNYRHISADLAKWCKDDINGNKKYYYMYYLRTAWTGPENKSDPMLKDKKGYYDIYSYDSYVADADAGNRSSKKRVQLDYTLDDDLFYPSKVMSCNTATFTNSIESIGVMTHEDSGTPLCMIVDGEFINKEVLDADFISGLSGNVNGSIIILKAGCSNSSTFSNVEAPPAICYNYNIISSNARAVNSKTFFLDIDYPAVNGIVTGVDNLDASKEIASVKYYDVAGRESVIPFRGINIVHVTYTDGTTTTAKVIK
ncbi:family 10 glycosylhydrolase [Sodaliphilus sp.]|uniref:family 10 glycosylhydrolase n=1 Tax=Sodaliphilus sp. TaxID=2815818 RepID=UPI00388DFA21